MQNSDQKKHTEAESLVRNIVMEGLYEKIFIKHLEGVENKEEVANAIAQEAMKLVQNAINISIKGTEKELRKLTNSAQILAGIVGYASTIIEAYEAEINDAMKRGAVSQGFCQGYIFKDALEVIHKRLSTALSGKDIANAEKSD